jgi:hypothetical protein
MPEFDLFFLLAAGEILRRLWLHWPESKPARIAIAGLVCAAFLGGVQYVAHAWKIYDWDGGWKGRIEYRITEWMHQNMPNSRALAAGSIRFWYNAWFNGQHVGGGSEQGLLNGTLYAAQWDLFVGEDRDLSILWLQATGTDAAIVSDQTSKEIYHDYVRPQKFEGLPILYDNGGGDRIYRVPRRFPGIARVVETGKALALRPIAGGGDAEGLRAYVAVVENGPDARAGSVVEKLNTIRVQANVAPGQSVLVMESFDPCFRAYSADRSLSIRKDAMGFMLVDTPPGAHDIRLVFETPLENWVGRVVTCMALGVVLLLLFGLRRREA